ncbi:hydrogenase maturation nickel metallochaperone HypA [Arcanobacterium hippocoleae]
MHELALCHSVVAAVEKAALKAKATKISKVALRVGRESGALPAALSGSWEIAVANTLLSGAQLEIEVIAAAVYCPNCARDVEIDEFFALLCPQCGTPTGNITRGKEFEIAWVEWESGI